jgi:hypothetical protein
VFDFIAIGVFFFDSSLFLNLREKTNFHLFTKKPYANKKIKQNHIVMKGLTIQTDTNRLMIVKR